MIEFNELKISTDNQCMIIDVSVKNISIYDNVYLDSIIIDNQDTFTNNGPSSNPVYSLIVEGDSKNFRIVLGNTDLDIQNNMFFVYISTKGTPSPDTPCSMDNNISVGILYNKYLLYKLFMNSVKEVESECNIPKNFINNILRLKALELCLSTGNYIQAIKYWNKFFKNNKYDLNTNICNG